MFKKLICKIFGHKLSTYLHDYGYSYGSSNQFKTKIYCIRCGMGDYRKND